jgi:hypothetical protein
MKKFGKNIDFISSKPKQLRKKKIITTDQSLIEVEKLDFSQEFSSFLDKEVIHPSNGDSNLVFTEISTMKSRMELADIGMMKNGASLPAIRCQTRQSRHQVLT